MAITVENLSFGYGSCPILRGISCRIPAGSFTVVLGRNGSGKSTLLKLLAGHLPASPGSILLHGDDQAALSPARRAALLGYLPQFHTPVFPFTAEDVVLTGRAAAIHFFPGERDRSAAREALAAVGIEALAGRSYSELSGGERQLVLIARILAQKPRIILLDEPISHLDLANQARLLALLRTLAAGGMTVVAVLHDPNAAALAADRLLLLGEGALLAEATTPVQWDARQLCALYGTPVDLVPYRQTALVVHQHAAAFEQP